MYYIILFYIFIQQTLFFPVYLNEAALKSELYKAL